MAPKHPTKSPQVRGVPASQSRPLEFKQAIRGFQAGKTFKALSEKTGFSVSTLQNIKKDNAELIASKQEQAVEKMIDVRDMALSRLHREMDDIKLESLPVAIGILSDKVRDMTGGNVTTVKHVSVKLPEDVQEKTVIDLLPTAKDCKEYAVQPGDTANTAPVNGLTNHGAADPAAAVQGAGGVADAPFGESLTHKARGKSFGKEKVLEGATQEEVERRRGTEQPHTAGSEGTVKLSTEGEEGSSRQSVPPGVEGDQT